MSAATMSGTDVKTNTAAAASKQQLKSSNTGKALDGARKQAASPVDGHAKKQQPPQQKAWQGPNPITQRAPTATPNGTEKPQPKAPSQQQNKSTADAQPDKHAYDRAIFLLSNLVGHSATLTLKNGEQFTGVFSGGSFESNSKHQYIMKMVKQTRPPTNQQVNGTIELPNEYVGEGEDHVMVFDKDDTIDLTAEGVVLAEAQSLPNGSINSSFRTDTEISSRDAQMPRERELQRWDAGDSSNVDLSLESSAADSGWDQFATNERMYGFQSTYDENIYTTSINRSDPTYKQREAQAARIAREIEGSAPSNAHVAEERRRDAERGDGIDEEEKYSGVQREAVVLPKRAAGAYVPPSQRPVTSGPTVHGAPFDPAIISSQVASPSQAPSAEKDADTMPAVQPTTVTEEQSVNSPLIPQEDKLVPQAQATAKTTTEDHVRNVTDSFKQFANSEKMRIKQAQEIKRSTARAEKNVKLNDLKKFAANFKLKSRVPDDLVPILAKDREKQIEIQHKAEEAWKEEDLRAKEKDKDKAAGGASPAPSPAASQATTASAVDPRTPFNQHSRARVSGSVRGVMPIPGQSPRQPAGQGVMHPNRAFHTRPLPPLQPLPADMRIPTGPAIPPSTISDPLSPASSTRLNVNAKAFEFRPAASNFTPSGTSPSPQRTVSSMGQSSVAESASFFEKDKKSIDSKDHKEVDVVWNPLTRMAEAEYNEEQKKKYDANGGVPQAYCTGPTWTLPDTNMNVSYKDSLKSHAPSQGQSPLHTPNPNAHMPHAHQVPPHMQGPPGSTPSQRQPYMPPPQHQGGHQGFDPRMQQFGPNGSVQSSPRFQQPQMAFNGQLPGMPMPQFAGQQMQGYGVSPSMQYRQVQMPPSGPMMMVPNQQHGQMGPMPPGYPRGPGPQYNPQMMGGAPMMNQHSNGGFMNGPGMPQHQQPSYSPMPPHAQPHMPGHMHNQGYGGSPRPQMMQHSGSHQGFPSGPMHMQHAPPFGAPSPGQPHPHHLQYRQMSSGGGYPQMTPRQQNSVPQVHQQSPGMVPTQGDEGK